MSAARADFEILIASTPTAPFEYWGQVLNSPGGQTPICPLSFKFLLTKSNTELELLKLKIENAFLRGSEANLRGPISPSERILIEFGKQAFQSIFVNAEPIRNAYLRTKAALGAAPEKTRLRIRLRVDAPELVGLPWEYLYDESDAPIKYVGLKYPLIRCLELYEPAQPMNVKGPLRILGMIANPSSDEWLRLDVAKERRRIDDAIDKLQEDGRVFFKWVESGTANSLLTALLEDEWHVFHFIGHGGSDDPSMTPDDQHEQSGESGFVVFVDEKGDPAKKYASELAMILGNARSPLKLAVLNCCESAKSNIKERFGNPASALVKSGLPAVVANQYPIGDGSAINMAEGFYRAITNGQSVEDAVTTARMFIQDSSKIEWGVPVLYMNAVNGNLFQFDDFEKKTTDAPGTPHKQKASDRESHASTEFSQRRTERLREFDRLSQKQTKSHQDLEALCQLGGELLKGQKDDPSLAERVAAAYYQLGVMQQRANDNAKAIASYSYAIELAPRHSEYRVRRANYNARLGFYEIALSDVAAAISIQPTNAEYFWIKGIICSMAAGTIGPFRDEAIAAFSTAIKLNAREVKYYRSRADAYADVGRKRAALIDLDTAIGLAPDDPDLVLQREKIASEDD
jgi:hypothetical protein